MNENLDFYDILLEFLDKLCKHSAKQRDVATALQNVIKLLNVVDIGTEGAIGGEEYVTETANQLMHILVDIDAEKGTTTFQPIKPVDEFLENRRSVIEKQVKDTCNHP
ncbi:MAG: hypothetical protein VZR53_00160 [Prevotella sp.]|nr:hypothetical protein [Prevotella sp.]